MATTPVLGIPYPIGTDRVTDGDNVMQAIAEFLDTKWAFGSCSQMDTGPGVNGTMWYAQCSQVGVAGGVTVNANGIVVPRRGYYEITARGLFNFGQAGATQANLFVGDGTGVWFAGGCQCGNSPALKQSIQCGGVVSLNAGVTVRWGMSCSGAAAAGMYGGNAYANLTARLLYPY